MVDTEKLRQKYSPEGSMLREYQHRMVEEVLFLDKVCKTHGLTYFLSGGSALGAVRHHGFIPWDDDMDITLPSEDFKKLVKILHEMDTAPYVLQDRYTAFSYTPVQNQPCVLKEDLGGGRIAAWIHGLGQKTTGLEMAESEPGSDCRDCIKLILCSFL